MMKKLILVALVLIACFSILQSRCQSFGFDGVLIGAGIYCTQTTISETYTVYTIAPLSELEGYAERPHFVPTPRIEIKTIEG